jgi:hypothetical protein
MVMVFNASHWPQVVQAEEGREVGWVAERGEINGIGNSNHALITTSP